jgi:hypothetical protein
MSTTSVGDVSVPIACPRCGVDHLHAIAYVDAEEGDRYEVVADGQEADMVLVQFTQHRRAQFLG